MNKTKQTKKWEDACLETRRNKKSRRKRLEYFDLKPKDKVLDLGCGDGLNVSILREMKVTNVSGADISKDLLKEAKKNNPKADFKVGSAEKIPFIANTFDVVLVDSVFHHLLDYKKPAKEIKRVLKKNGKLCLIEPHNSFLRNLLDYLSVQPISKYLPVLNKRRVTYLEEQDLMEHWLSTEEEFFATLKQNKFKEIFRKTDFLSVVGKYQVAK